MRKFVGALVAEGGTLQDAYQVDWSAYIHLDAYDELERINAGRIFGTMEFE